MQISKLKEKLKAGKSKDGKIMHYSVGAVIRKGGKILMIDRVKFPFGWACIAGHVNEGEDSISALKREVKEETGFEIEDYNLLAEEEIDLEECSRGIEVHNWHVFECEVEGYLKIDPNESKFFGWFSKEEIEKLKLEKVWAYWLKKLKII